jgi:hypothetical protein
MHYPHLTQLEMQHVASVTAATNSVTISCRKYVAMLSFTSADDVTCTCQNLPMLLVAKTHSKQVHNVNDDIWTVGYGGDVARQLLRDHVRLNLPARITQYCTFYDVCVPAELRTTSLVS